MVPECFPRDSNTCLLPRTREDNPVTWRDLDPQQLLGRTVIYVAFHSHNKKLQKQQIFPQLILYKSREIVSVLLAHNWKSLKAETAMIS